MRLERIQRDFLWGGGNLDKKPHPVKWSTVCTYKKKGGLSVRSLSKLNKALLCKWNWRFSNEREISFGEMSLEGSLECLHGAGVQVR